MKELIAKKYVQALLADLDNDTANKYFMQLNKISIAFQSDKLISIIKSPDVSKDKRTELFLSMLEKADDRLINFIKLLGENSRFDIIPDIVSTMKKEINQMNNSYEGVVFVKDELDSKTIKNLEKQFSKKFNTSLTLTQNVGNYDGIKVDIDGLGVEVSFSTQRLKSSLSEYILQAI